MTGGPNDVGGGGGSGSGGSVFVNTDRLAAGIPLLDGLMQRLSAIGEFTTGALDGYHLDGGDEYYKAFAQVHDPLSQQLLTGLKDAASVFKDSAGGAELMLRNYIATEDNNIDTAGGLLSRRSGV